MRYYEFAIPARPILKISQPAQPAVNTPATPLPKNNAPTPAPTEPIKVYPRAWQPRWLREHKPSSPQQMTSPLRPYASVKPNVLQMMNMSERLARLRLSGAG